ncbi:MAG: class I SAM-dependent methyltransferase [Polyangiales bacterium]
MSEDRSEDLSGAAVALVQPKRTRPKPLRVPIDHVARVSIVDELVAAVEAPPVARSSAVPELSSDVLEEIEPELLVSETSPGEVASVAAEAEAAEPAPEVSSAAAVEAQAMPAPAPEIAPARAEEPEPHEDSGLSDEPELHEEPEIDETSELEGAPTEPNLGALAAAAQAAPADTAPEPGEPAAPPAAAASASDDDSTEITVGPASGELSLEASGESPTEAPAEHDEDIELEEVSEHELALHAKPKAPAAVAEAAKAPPAPPDAPKAAPPAPPSPPEGAKAGPPAPPAAKAGPPAPPAEPARAAAPPKPPAEIPLPKKRQKPWYEDFFSDDYLRTVRHPTEREIAKECDFIEKVLGLPAGATVLDVGCGLGLYAIELTKRGYLVVGLDLSLPMLSRASEDAKDQGLRINFLHGDMREMSFDGSFDVVLSWGTAFGYFDDEGNRKVLQRFYNSLKPGGMLLLDVANRDFVVRTQPNLVWFEGDGCICMEETKFNYLNSRLEVSRNVILDDGKQRDRSYSIRLYALHELGLMLHQQRFRVSQVSGNRATPGVFFGADSPRLIVLAERKREDEPRSSPPPPAPPEGGVSSPPAASAPPQAAPAPSPSGEGGSEGGAS